MVKTAVHIEGEAIADVCRRYGVARLRLFGSALRSDFDPARSDIDLLVEFLPGVSKSLFKIIEMEEVLAKMLGRDVDLMTPRSLSKYFREDVLKSAQVLYDAA
jgi:predicted nucleotidyltransferase